MYLIQFDCVAIYCQLVAPGKPREVTARLQPRGSILVDWKHPEDLNGIIISYQVCLMLSKKQPIVMVDAFCVRRRWVVGC